MKQLVMVIKDKLIGCGSLLSYPNPESAVRSFKEIINGDNQIGRHAQDHELMAIGTYETETGKLEAFEEPRLIAKGSDLMQKQETKK